MRLVWWGLAVNIEFGFKVQGSGFRGQVKSGFRVQGAG
jgi:hypothetical protein